MAASAAGHYRHFLSLSPSSLSDPLTDPTLICCVSGNLPFQGHMLKSVALRALYSVSNTTARCVLFFFCFGVDLFISQVDNEALAVCNVSGCKDVDLPSGCSTRWACTCWRGGIVLRVCQSWPVSISVSVFSPLLSVSLWVYLRFFFFLCKRKRKKNHIWICFFSVCVCGWVCLSQLPTSIISALSRECLSEGCQNWCISRMHCKIYLIIENVALYLWMH